MRLAYGEIKRYKIFYTNCVIFIEKILRIINIKKPSIKRAINESIGVSLNDT